MSGQAQKQRVGRRAPHHAPCTCYLGLGSNLGDRRAAIRAAVAAIGGLTGTRVLKESRLVETEPEGGPPGQRRYLNGALKISTTLAPQALLAHLKSIEQSLGRRRTTVRNGPRIIDIDILLYGNRVIATAELIVPHPRMFDRWFVLSPLAQIWA